ncbi:SRPBCC domain-containing protein [Chroococcidiopsis sp. CCMEE 29]|uniref:SRPBCC domain-containing protein n=1 Tax=Chroococcidiopsis sp. CCMEE 29 TaxID=155894 RepID=UPI0020216AD5|nr:SRPBCC domain-containing protein [Chroococcidiopsis sp. CCMEE 29]
MIAKDREAIATSEREFTLARLFDAPRSLVFKVWTQPEHFSRWLGPKDFTTTFCQMDVRLGGTYRACIRSPEGTDHWMQGVYHEIVEPERLVFTFAWEDENGQPKHQTIVTVTFIEQGSKTVLTFHQAVFESVESRDLHQSGWSECLDRLEVYLANAMTGATQ